MMTLFRNTLLLILLAACCGFHGAVPRLTHGDRTGVQLEAAGKLHGWAVQSAGPEHLELGTPERSVRLTSGSEFVLADHTRIKLLQPVLRLPSGEWMAGEPDLLETLFPALSSEAVPNTPVRRVVLDAGHGGQDPGAQYDNIQEKEINLDLAKRLEKRLSAAGLQVILTRRGDRFAPLSWRAEQVRLEDADIFISLHQNAAPNPEASGIECYFSPKNRFAGASLRLALEIQSALIGTFQAQETPLDRGVRRADFQVIRRADCPAVLLECGFLSNEADRRQMKKEDYLDEFVQAAAQGILDYCRIRRSPGAQEGEEE